LKKTTQNKLVMYFAYLHKCEDNKDILRQI